MKNSLENASKENRKKCEALFPCVDSMNQVMKETKNNA